MTSIRRITGWGWAAIAAACLLGTARAESEPGMTQDSDRARIAPGSLDLRAAGLFRLSDGSLVFRVQTVEPTDLKNLRVLLDTDGPGRGLPESGADCMIEGGLFYRYPAGGTGWAWDEVCAVASIADGAGGVSFLLPAIAPGASIRWAVESLGPDWKTADRLPDTGMIEALSDALPELKPSAATGPLDVSPLTTNAPPTLCTRFRREVGEMPWEADKGAPSMPRIPAPFAAEGLVAQVLLRDARTGESAECRPEKTYRDGDRMKWTGKTLGVDWTLLFERRPDGALKVAGEVECAQERCLQVAAGCTLPAGEWTWHDDVRTSRAFRAGEPRLQHVRPCPYGLRREQSVYPFGVVSSSGGSLAAESDSTEPRVFQIYAEPETRWFGISYDLALSPLTAKFPGRATFSASLRPYGPTGEGVFRHALTQWYVRESAYAERRAPPFGLWLQDYAGSAAPETGDAAAPMVACEGPAGIAAAPARGIFLGVLSPWHLRLPLPRDAARTDAAALRLVRFHAAVARGEDGLAAVSALLGGARRADGAFDLSFRDADGAAVARLGVSVDPEFMTTSSAPVNRAMSEWRRAAEFLGAAEARGIALDSLAALDGIDYNRAALAVADYPCTYTAKDLRPGLAAPLAACEFLFPLARALHVQRKLLAASEATAYPFFPCAADVLVQQTALGAPPAAGELAAWRALAGRKPVAWLADGAFDAADAARLPGHFAQALFWGFLPGVAPAYWNDPRRFERDGELFRSWLPLARRLADAGWEPYGPAVSATPTVRVEWFGRPEAPIRHGTLLNTADAAALAEVRVAGIGGPVMLVQPLSAACEILLPQDGQVLAHVPVAASAVATFDVVPLTALDKELQFMDGWKSGGGESAAALKNLRSVRREMDAGLTCRVSAATPAIRGSRNTVALRVANGGAGPVVISDVRLQLSGRQRTLDNEPRILAQGETADYAGTFTEEDLSGNPWLEVQWRAQSGSNDWNCVRAVRPVVVDALGISARSREIVSLKPAAGLELDLRNQSKLPRSLRVVWDGDFETGRMETALEPESLRTVRLAVTSRRRGTDGRLLVRVLDGQQEVYRGTFHLTFLADNASLARDSRVEVTADATAAGTPVEALTDGVTRNEGGGGKPAVWSTGDRAGDHWVRMALPEPTAVREVKLFWPAGRGAPLAARHGAIHGTTPDGRDVLMGEYAGGEGEACTTVTFDPVTVKSLEVRQPAGGGPGAYPDRMSLSEIEVR